MTVLFSKKCELGLQAVLFLSTQEKGHYLPAAEISEKMNIPKEYVSKILQVLTYSGIVGSKKGKNGGFFLAEDPKKIKLIDIIESIDGLKMFKKCILGFEDCNCKTPCPIHNKWGKIRDDVLKMFANESLEQLRSKTKSKLTSLKLNSAL